MGPPLRAVPTSAGRADLRAGGSALEGLILLTGSLSGCPAEPEHSLEGDLSSPLQLPAAGAVSGVLPQFIRGPQSSRQFRRAGRTRSDRATSTRRDIFPKEAR